MRSLLFICCLLIGCLAPCALGSGDPLPSDAVPPQPVDYLGKAAELFIWQEERKDFNYFDQQNSDDVKLVLDDRLQTAEHHYLAASYYANYLSYQSRMQSVRHLCARISPRDDDYFYLSSCLLAADLPLDIIMAKLQDLAERAHQVSPESDHATRIYYGLSNLLMDRARVVSAIRVIKRALEIVPQQYPSLVIDLKTALAFAYINPLQNNTIRQQALTNLQEAIAFYESPEHSSPDDALLLTYNVGIAKLFLFADYESAIEAFQKARAFSRLALDSDVFAAHAAAMKGDKERARKLLSAIDPKAFGEDTRSAFLLCYYQLTQHLLDPQQSVEACMTMEPPQADVLMNLTEIFSRLSLPAEVENQWWRKFYRRFQDVLLPDIQENLMAASAEAELVEERAENRMKDLKLKNLELYEYLLITATILCLLLAVAGVTSYRARRSSLRFARQVNQQRKRLQHILDSVVECIYVIHHDLRMEAEPTPHFSKVMGNGFSLQMDLTSFLGLTHAAKDQQAAIIAAVEAAMGEASLVWELNAGQLPYELNTDERALSLAWQPVFHDDVLQSIFLAIRDVSETRALQEAHERAQRNADRLMMATQEIMRAPRRSVQRFLDELPSTLDQLRSLIQSGDHKAAIRFAHGMKGNARHLGLGELRDSVHVLESLLLSGNEDSRQQAFLTLEEVIRLYLEGVAFMRLTPTDSDNISLISVVADIKTSIIKQLAAHNIKLQSLALEESGMLQAEEYSGLKTILMHGLSNALDHGYIRPAMKGGTRRPVVLSINLQADDHERRLVIRDQGVGIDHNALQKIAKQRQWQPLANGLWSDILFLDEISTADHVTQSSGRGVGLAAVAEVAVAWGGRAQLTDNDQGHGAMLLVTWPSPSEPVISKSAS